jgi:hypothetical protein
MPKELSDDHGHAIAHEERWAVHGIGVLFAILLAERKPTTFFLSL